ncbi:MAG: molybdopterin oxidoreductase family protein [Anaerolineae bacterium]|nr:molybdopterin oxidoreductase family protein [Anaerolineae bacterium]
MSIQKVYGACPHDCPDTCGFITEVQDGRAVNFYANPEHPITEGWLCAKVRPYLDHVYHPDRLKYPLRRVGPKGSGQWARISWDEALAEIGERWRGIIDQYGAAAILPYSYSGTLGLVQMLVSSGRFWQRLGASQLERSICGAAAEYAVNMTLGVRHSPLYDHVEDSQLVIIWGHNPVSTAPHFMPHLKAAQRNGCRVVVIDPRRTRTARGADLHLAPLPGTDGALALGMAHVIVTEGLHDEAWLTANTVGWPQLRERLDEYPPERAAAITGLPALDIIELARNYATSRPALIKIADGLQRNRTGGQNVRAICTLPALTGQYGLRGGGLGYSTSGYVMWDGRALLHWDECPPAARSVNMNRLGAALLGEVTDPPIMSLFVFGANPAAISPNAGKIVEGLKRDDLFTVVHELFMTDTADYADLVLPATSQLEQVDLHKSYGHTWLTYNHQAIPPLGESKSNLDVMSLLAKTMSFTEPWLHHSADEVIDEVLTATTAHHPALQGITLEKLKNQPTLPLTMDNHVPFADLRFRTPSGKVELYSASMAKQGLDPLPGWSDPSDDAAPPEDHPQPDSRPLNLITAAAHHFVTSSMANQDSMLRREGPPFVEIHPTDAADRGIVDGDVVIVENERGWCKLKAVVTDAIRPGVLASPKGRWAKFDPFQNGEGGRNVNWTVSDALGDMAGQSTFHSNRVWVRKS